MEHARILEKIIEWELGGTVVSAHDVTGGYVGYVYKVQAVVDEEPRTFCVKLSPLGRDSASQVEPVDDRVYGRIPVTERELFFLYYLLSWLPGCYEDWKGKLEKQSSTIKHFEDLILATVLRV